MPQDFLDLAYDIRRELYPEFEGIGLKKFQNIIQNL